jgi:GNAT superfamily N-acetyltransferase
MRESLEALGRFDPQRARDRFLANFSPECTRHIRTKDGRIGFLVLREKSNEILLEHLYIHPGHQGKSIGTAVLSVVFAEADAKAKSLRVGALKESRSNDFYTIHGFRFVAAEEWDNFYIRVPKSAV